MKSDMLIKASMKTKEEIGSDYESAEEDAPVVRLEELLGNMKITDDDKAVSSGGEDDAAWESGEEEKE